MELPDEVFMPKRNKVVELLTQGLIPEDWKPDPTQPLGYDVRSFGYLTFGIAGHDMEGFVWGIVVISHKYFNMNTGQPVKGRSR